MTQEEAPAATLFDEEELAALHPGRPGRVEAMLQAAVKEATDKGTLIREDLGMIGAALAGARALDVAERGGSKGGPYATAALLTPYREVLQALRLPAAVAPEEAPRPPSSDGAVGADFLRDHFGAAD